MNDLNNNVEDMKEQLTNGFKEEERESARKGPLSFFTGAITSWGFAWLCLGLSRTMVVYFTKHVPSYNSAIAQSIGSAFKTLVIGMCFLATFTFAFIGLGLTLVFIRSLFAGKESYLSQGLYVFIPLVQDLSMTVHDLGLLVLLLCPGMLLSVLLLSTFAAGG